MSENIVGDLRAEITSLQAKVEKLEAELKHSREAHATLFENSVAAAVYSLLRAENSTLQAHIKELESANEAICLWTEGHDGEFWNTSCGITWAFIDGGPEDLGIGYCPHCGKIVELKGAE